MSMNTTTTTVTFANPFLLRGFNEALPAGSYNVETDWVLLEGVSHLAYRRERAVIQLLADPGHPGHIRTLTIDPNELDAALMRDQTLSMVRHRANSGQGTPAGETNASREELDRQAVDRAENEGMLVGSGKPASPRRQRSPRKSETPGTAGH